MSSQSRSRMPYAHAVGVCDHEGDVGPDFMGVRELVEGVADRFPFGEHGAGGWGGQVEGEGDAISRRV